MSEEENKPQKSNDYLVPPIIAKALIQIQRELKPLLKSAENDAYSSSYVPLDEVMAKALQLLSDRKIALLQPMVTDSNGHAALETILVHDSGKSFSRTTKLAMNKVDPQSHGSAVTYTRRYALMTIIGLTAKNDDDDGNKASGVFAPITEEQIHEIKMLLGLMKWTRNDIAKAVFALKTRDAAALAIMKYQTLVSERVRDEESKQNATAIEVGTDASGTEPAGDSDPTSPEGFKSRLKALKLASPSYENKVILSATKKPFLSKVVSEADVKALDEMLKALEEGRYRLEADFYAPTNEPITVNENVA